MTLFQIGHLAAIHCAENVRIYEQLRIRAVGPIPAVIHIANKVNRILFRMLKEQKPYKSQISPEYEEKWMKVSKKRRKIN